MPGLSPPWGQAGQLPGWGAAPGVLGLWLLPTSGVGGAEDRASSPRVVPHPVGNVTPTSPHSSAASAIGR